MTLASQAQEMANLAYALSGLFGNDTDVDIEEASLILGLRNKLLHFAPESFDNRPETFSQNWNLARGVFFGPNASVPLEESVYKSWTDDKGHPLLEVKGMAWGDSAMHMQSTLREFGVDYDRSRLSAPDHLAVILEFLGFLLESERTQEANSFSNDHLDWLEQPLERIKSIGLSESVQQIIKTVIELRNSLILLN